MGRLNNWWISSTRPLTWWRGHIRFRILKTEVGVDARCTSDCSYQPTIAIPYYVDCLCSLYFVKFSLIYRWLLYRWFFVFVPGGEKQGACAPCTGKSKGRVYGGRLSTNRPTAAATRQPRAPPACIRGSTQVSVEHASTASYA